MQNTNSLQHSFSMAAAFALAGALCAAAPADTAAATLEGNFKAYSVKKEKKRQPFEHYVEHYCGSNSCVFNVLTVPNNRRLEIRSISCYAYVESGGEIYYAYLERNRTEPSGMKTFLTPERQFDGGAVYYASRDELRFIANAGNTLSYTASASDNIGHFWCHMAGDRITYAN